MLKFIGINEEKKICLPDKEYNKWQRSESINMGVKCIVYMHITAEVKAYCLSCLNSAVVELIKSLKCLQVHVSVSNYAVISYTIVHLFNLSVSQYVCMYLSSIYISVCHSVSVCQ